MYIIFYMLYEKKMWYPLMVTTAGITVGVSGLAAMRARTGPAKTSTRDRPTETLVDKIEALENAQDAVLMLQNMCSSCATEDAASQLADVMVLHGISESALSRLSLLHRRHGAELGLAGYATNMIWASVLQAITEGAVVVVDAIDVETLR